MKNKNYSTKIDYSQYNLVRFKLKNIKYTKLIYIEPDDIIDIETYQNLFLEGDPVVDNKINSNYFFYPKKDLPKSKKKKFEISQDWKEVLEIQMNIIKEINYQLFEDSYYKAKLSPAEVNEFVIILKNVPIYITQYMYLIENKNIMDEKEDPLFVNMTYMERIYLYKKKNEAINNLTEDVVFYNISSKPKFYTYKIYEDLLNFSYSNKLFTYNINPRNRPTLSSEYFDVISFLNYLIIPEEINERFNFLILKKYIYNQKYIIVNNKKFFVYSLYSGHEGRRLKPKQIFLRKTQDSYFMIISSLDHLGSRNIQIKSVPKTVDSFIVKEEIYVHKGIEYWYEREERERVDNENMYNKYYTQLSLPFQKIEPLNNKIRILINANNYINVPYLMTFLESIEPRPFIISYFFFYQGVEYLNLDIDFQDIPILNND